jgi:hypothetical protein
MDLEDSGEEDVDEIPDEEEELIVVLEQEMSLLELCLVSELEALWSAETDKLIQIQARNSEVVSTPLIDLEVYFSECRVQ